MLACMHNGGSIVCTSTATTYSSFCFSGSSVYVYVRLIVAKNNRRYRLNTELFFLFVFRSVPTHTQRALELVVFTVPRSLSVKLIAVLLGITAGWQFQKQTGRDFPTSISAEKKPTLCQRQRVARNRELQSFSVGLCHMSRR